MKKLIILFVIALLTIAANWHIANQVIVKWAPVAETVDGDPIPAEQISYNMYLREPGGTGSMKVQ